MSRRPNLLWASVVVILIGLLGVIAGCGGGDSSSSSGSSPSVSSDPSAQFIKKGGKGNNTYAEFGEEAPAEEREVANVVVVESLKARAAGDFQAQCETLGQKGIQSIPNAKTQQDCVKALKQFGEPLSKTKYGRRDTLSGAIAVLRVEGDKGIALYHGNDGNDYEIPLEKEGGVWKVSSVFSTEI